MPNSCQFSFESADSGNDSMVSTKITIYLHSFPVNKIRPNHTIKKSIYQENDTFQCFSGVSCYRRRLMSPNASILAMTTSSSNKNPLPKMKKVMNFEINFAPITQALNCESFSNLRPVFSSSECYRLLG